MTPLARARFVGLCGVFGGALAALTPACGLDWTVRDDPGDGPRPESSRPDVVVIDGGPDGPADGPDTSLPDANPCVGLGEDVATARLKAKECAFGTAGQCTTTVKDECDCPVVVRASGSTQNTTYAKAIADLLAKCPKPKACDSLCPVLPAPASWACLVKPADAGGGAECFPP